MNAVANIAAPILPVQYSAAVTALTECLSIDEAKTWSDKADALAAWAHIYNQDDAGIAAKRLKLHAYRRIYALAKDVQPQGRHRPGPQSLLKQYGFKSKTREITRIGRLPQAQFDSFVNQPNPPTPSRILRVHLNKCPEWSLCQQSFVHCRSAISKIDRYEIAKSLTPREVSTALTVAEYIYDWLGEFINEVKRKEAA